MHKVKDTMMMCCLPELHVEEESSLNCVVPQTCSSHFGGSMAGAHVAPHALSALWYEGHYVALGSASPSLGELGESPKSHRLSEREACVSDSLTSQ